MVEPDDDINAVVTVFPQANKRLVWNRDLQFVR